ncbi:hypothetical protein F2Q70_00025830 [Brassica cretica]|uniref:Uncharacterized protein n=1 Tax=Brassica cretica TaxID=69181 RepID=A0A8S9L8X5_BRACR|nr:hypothetical protein F2Q70_00025830 [Brassica cretica]
MDQEVFKRADLEAFFKALNESGNTLGNTLGYSHTAHTLPSNTDKLLDIFKSSYTTASNPRNTDKLLDIFKSAYTTASEPSITTSSGAKVGESEGIALASHQLIGKGMDQEVFKRALLEAFFKALKESGNTLGNTFGYSYAAHTLPSTTDKLLDIFKISYTAASNPSNTDKLLDMFKSAYTATISIDVRDEVLIDVGWKISVDGRVVSVDGGERVSVDEIGVWVDGGWRVSIDELVLLSIDELVLLSIDEELLPLRIKRSKLAGSDENSSGVSLLLLVLHGMHLKRQEKKFMSERGLKK